MCERRYEKGLYRIECANCGKEFGCNSAYKLYCSNKCRVQANEKRWQEKREIHLTKEQRKKKVTESAAKIAAINARAKQAELSYGQYVAIIDEKVPRVRKPVMIAEAVKEYELDMVCGTCRFYEPLPNGKRGGRKGSCSLQRRIVIHRYYSDVCKKYQR